MEGKEVAHGREQTFEEEIEAAWEQSGAEGEAEREQTFEEAIEAALEWEWTPEAEEGPAEKFKREMDGVFSKWDDEEGAA